MKGVYERVAHTWKLKDIRQQVEVVDGLRSPTLLLKNARYLNSPLRKWMKANIWVYKDRIVYVGNKLPENDQNCEVVNCDGKTVVPGYIEPHVHPFQLYNPYSFSKFAAQTGTTTFVNDNLVLFLQLNKKKAFTLIDELNKMPVSIYWWARFDAQTEMRNEEACFSNHKVRSWLDHEDVIQGGELTGWPRLLQGDDMMLSWMQEAKKRGKRIEGHFPGASEKTLTKMALMGADADHESMTGEEVQRRLELGYQVSLRHSSIRPDLPVLLKEIQELGIDQYDQMAFTTDGSTPAFYEKGILDWMINEAIESGVPDIDAYHMASYNIAKYYRMDHLQGMIAPGRLATLNLLKDSNHPTPESVLSKGKWLKRDNQDEFFTEEPVWNDFGVEPMKLSWDLKESDLQFSMPFGIEMINAVITKPYSVSIDTSREELDLQHDQSFLVLLDRHGKWKINTLIKGFATGVKGFASSYSNTGDIILIGKRKQDMIAAFNRMKELEGGMVLVEDGEIIHEIPLTLTGVMSDLPVEELIQQEKGLRNVLKERGYTFSDPVYTLLFLSSTHLPYVRITPLGIYDVMKKSVFFPSIIR